MTGQLKQKGRDWLQDILAGLTMAIALLPGLLLIPTLLNEGSMDFKGAFTAYVIASIAGTLLLGAWRLPLAAGSSVILTYYLVYLGIVANGLTWNQLLGISLVVSILGMLLFLSPWGKKLCQAIPQPVRFSLPLGIGAMLIWLGLTQSHIFIASPYAVTMLGNFQDPLAFIGLIGIVLTLGMLARRWRFSLLLGGVVTAIIALNEGFWEWPSEDWLAPQGLDKVAGFLDVWAVSNSQYPLMLGTGLTMLLVLISSNLGVLASEQEEKPRTIASLFALSAVGSLIGALPVVASPLSLPGGKLAKKGWRSTLVAALLLLLALYMEPVLAAMADFPVMTVPVLVGGGILLIATSLRNLRQVSLSFEALLPMLCVILVMPLSCNLAAALGTGIISFVLIQLANGKYRQIPMGTAILALLFAVYFVYGTV